MDIVLVGTDEAIQHALGTPIGQPIDDVQHFQVE
jgi:hypothetical protein